MAEDIRTLRTRIKSVQGMQSLTTAMGLVATSRRPRAMRAFLGAKEYDEGIRRVIAPLLSEPDCQKGRYFQGSERPCCVVAISADRGMAGGFDTAIYKALRQKENVFVLPIGKRICERHEREIVSAQDFDMARAKAMAEEICADFLSGKYGRVELLYTHYESVFVRRADTRRLLPLQAGEGAVRKEMIFEPDAEQMLAHVVPTYVAGALLRAVRESVACELVARAQAMDVASKNAKEMLDEMRLSLGRARQSAITQEISEIVASIGE